ncbi:Aminoglycoside phosphotransferase [Penicillium digitatum]|uniref:Aminoglycoside phosphotransferase n=1 Tax=Penicillium digitatum TaxID=36651 RepID=A0A7T6XVC0_PENDI|nr:Aminoglycoside phosphotransferase [Penicillium digitatum]
MDDWFRGSFNVCVPVTIENWKERQQPGLRVILRFPLPYRVGEGFRPGNGDEKIRCEAGAYAWLQQNCPDVPIARLYGFAMSTGETFTRIEHLPFLSRCFQSLRRRLLQWLRLPVPSYYVRRSNTINTCLDGVSEAGYLLIEFIEETQGTMLSNTWTEKQHDVQLRKNFFRSLSHILLSISRTPLPRIGSFVIDKEGYLTLSNRPLSMELQELENEKIPTGLCRDYTYSTVESYITDILGVHDSRLRNQPNAVNNVQDCGYQMSALAAMRTIAPLFFSRAFHRGPFVFTLTDLHQSNIFVDNEWRITCLVDLEWACTRPIQMVEPPYWLTNEGVDEIDVGEYNKLRKELLTIMKVEETEKSHNFHSKDAGETPLRLSEVMDQAWTTGTFWYSLALSSPTGLFSLFYDHIQPLLSTKGSDEIGEIMPFYWGKDVGKFVATKLDDKKQYDRELRQAFAVSGSEGDLSDHT